MSVIKINFYIRIVLPILYIDFASVRCIINAEENGSLLILSYKSYFIVIH